MHINKSINFAIIARWFSIEVILEYYYLIVPYILVPNLVYIRGVLKFNIPHGPFCMCSGGFILGMHKIYCCAVALIVHIYGECTSALSRANFLFVR